MKNRYALNLKEDNRILSVTFNEYAPTEQPRVDTLPDGDITDYLYHADTNSFEHKPLPKPEPPQPPETGDAAAEIAHLKERINKLEHNMTKS